MEHILKGAAAAAALDEQTMGMVSQLRDRGVEATLAILRVGQREDDVAYERGAVKRCEKVGVAVRSVKLPEDVGQEALMDTIRALNRDDGVHGVLLFRPLPKGLDETAACAALDPEKDVDGMTAASAAAVYTGMGTGFAPCTAQACMEVLKFYGINPAGKRAVVIGRSLVVGRPAAMLLMRANATVTICHTKTVDMPAVARGADIVVAAAGIPEAFGPAYFSPGQVVLDVGINWSGEKGRMVGDVDFENVEGTVAAITPVPAGVGALTTSVLASHVAEAAGKRLLGK